MGDIKAMFHHLKVPKDQCWFLKFLWWDDSDPGKKVTDYEMTAHVFGGAFVLKFWKEVFLLTIC